MELLQDSEDDDDFTDPNPLIFDHPFNLIIVGKTGSGKTTLLKILIKYYLKFDALYICAKTINETKYLQLRERYTLFDGIERDDLELLNKKDKKLILEWYDKYKKEVLFTSDLNEFITVDDLDPSQKNLIIFDDCVNEKDQSKIDNFFIRGRKYNASNIYLTQKWFGIPRGIRENANCFIFLKGIFKDIYRAIRDIDCISKDEFKIIYKKVFQDEHDFLVFDKKYRRNFNPI